MPSHFPPPRYEQARDQARRQVAEGLAPALLEQVHDRVLGQLRKRRRTLFGARRAWWLLATVGLGGSVALAAWQPWRPARVPDEVRKVGPVHVEVVGAPVESEATGLSAPLAPKSAARSVSAPRAQGVAGDLWWQRLHEMLAAAQCERLDRAVADWLRSAREPAQEGRARMASAECRLRRKEVAAALQIYEGVAAKFVGSWSGELAHFEVAKILAEMGQASRALETLDGYLQRYPDGRFVGAASFRRCEALIHVRRLADAGACLQTYRQRFPQGEKAADAALLLATQARLEQRCGDAVALYDVYLATILPGTADEEVAYQRLSCLRRLRDPRLANHFEAFLAAHPHGKRADEVRLWQKGEAP
ncbi:MAG: hypothetical protein AAB426_15030 [Myxococcota bacterium]